MSNLKININDDKAEIYTPYSAEFVRKIKGIGNARWDSSKKCWTIPVEFVNVAREIMVDVYGESDVIGDNMLKVRLTFLDCVTEEHADVVIMGKIICHASHRDSGGRVCNDVALITGEVYSGGSRNHWHSGVSKDTVVELTNVSQKLYDKYMKNPNEKIKAEIIEENQNKEKLEAEKARLLARLSEIEKLLSEQ